MTLKPLRKNVIGRMIDGFGEKITHGGVIINERNGGEESIRPRWFKVTHVGPEQDEVAVGDYVLVAHARWSRGIDIENTRREEDMVFLLDTDEILATSKENPV
jgi:co-chaperonin GroES (HSP10)